MKTDKTNIFQQGSSVSECVREWDKQLRTREWVSTKELFSGKKKSAYDKAIKQAKKEISIELAKRGMSLREQRDTKKQSRKLIAYPSYNRDPLHDLRVMAEIEQAMDFPHKALRLTYAQSYHQAKEHIFHAHYLNIYNGRYYVYGIYENEEENQGVPFVTLAVDRIVEVSTTQDVPYRSGDPKKYEDEMKDVLGASPNFRYPEVRKVSLRTHDPKVHKLLLNKPLHHSIQEQKPCIEGQTGLLTLHVQLTQELKNCILYYGQGVEVVAPKILRRQIAEGLSKMVTYYLPKNK